MKKVFFTLIMIALLSGCSTDPEVDFKGKVDEEFLMSISRCEIPMTLVPNDKKSHIYTRTCKDGKQSKTWNVYSANDEPNVHMFSGTSWVVYSKMPWDSEDYLLDCSVERAWQEYKKQLRYDKIQMRKCLFEYDPQTKRILFDDKWWNVESASKKSIVISYSFECKEDYHSQPFNIAKRVYTYDIKPLYYDPENVDLYDSVIDVMLSHIRILKEYKGDIWRYSQGGSRLNLSMLEDALLAGKIKYEDLDEGEYEQITMLAN